MKYTSLHKIITGYLLQRRYPIHFYVEFLVYANRGFQELHFDSLKNVRTKKLPLNSYGAATLPCDYMDWSKIGVPNGQFIKPLANRPGLSRLNSFDDTGEKVAYPSEDDPAFRSPFGLYVGLGYSVRYNDKLENTGRLYGSRGNQSQTFGVFVERNEIQVNIDVNATEMVLEYISDGQEIDNATMVHPYAIHTIEAWINWKHKENNRSYSEGERMRAQRQFELQHRILRARLNPISVADIKAIINRNNHAAIK